MKSLFRILFGSKNKSVQKNQSTKVSIPIPEQKVLFLKRVKGTVIDFDFNNLHYKKHLGNLQKVIGEFIENKYLKISIFEDHLTVKELKEILASNSLETKGNKSDLIARIISNLDQRSYKNKEFRPIYVLTDKGKKFIDEEEKIYLDGCEKFAETLYELIQKKDLETAKKLVLIFNKNQNNDNPIGLYELENFTPRNEKTINYFYNSPSLLTDLVLSNDEKQKLSDMLCCYSLFSHFNIVKKITETFDNFYPQEIADFLEKNENGKIEKNAIIQTFVDYEYMHSNNKARLSEILDSKVKDRFYGVEIIACHGCSNDKENEKFKWKELKKLPLLPRYPSCNCIYAFATE